MLGLKAYPGFHVAIIKLGYTAPYWCWLLARAQSASGCVYLPALLNWLKQHQISTRRFERALKHPAAALFFTRHGDYLYYVGVGKLAQTLNAAPLQPVSLPLLDILSEQAFRSRLYATWVQAHSPLYISREDLEQIFGVCQDTLRTWERRAGVVVHFQAMEVTGHKPESELWDYVPRDKRAGREGEVPLFEHEGRLFVRQINCYTCEVYVRLPRGQTRKIRCPVEDCGDGQRLFFEQPARHCTWTQGACLVRSKERLLHTKRHTFKLWEFSKVRPVAFRLD